MENKFVVTNEGREGGEAMGGGEAIQGEEIKRYKLLGIK